MTLVYLNVKIEDLDYLKSHGYIPIETTNKYELLRLKSPDAVLILYSSGKLVVQTSKDNEFTIDRILSKFVKLQRESFPHKNQFALKQNVIGSDESLKGDTFGGLVVCAFYCKEEDVSLLADLGVKDSKKLFDDQIITIATALKYNFKENFAIKELLPEEYNDLLSIDTQTVVLNNMHNLVGSMLKMKFGPITHVVDQYPGCKAGNIQDEKAESKYLAVAAASILARAKAVEQINYLSKKSKISLPLGSTHVKEALEELKEKGLNPKEFCKLDFKNVQNIFQF